MKRKLKVSVGIAAYNERKTIGNVLKDILLQNQKGWILSEVIVICDGCTDGTAFSVKRFKNKYINLIEDGERKGKTLRLKEMFEMFEGDILIMFDADIRFANKEVISNLIQPFYDRDVMLVGGNSRPFIPRTFVEKAVYSTFSVFYESRKAIKGGNNIFGATGSILAIRKELAKIIELPKIICEDAFIYLDCIKRGFKFKYKDDAIVYYKLPSNFRDYIRQVFRSNPESVESELNKYFDSLVREEFRRPFGFYSWAILSAFIRNPLGVIAIMTINLLCRPFHSIIMKNYKLQWFTASSTHQAYKL